MSIKKMRPPDIFNKIYLMREKSGVSFYLNNSDDFVHVTCPACDNTENKVYFYKYGYSHRKCERCNTLYVSPRPTEKMLFNYYKDYEAPKTWTELLVKTNSNRKYLQHLPRVKILKEVISQIDNKKVNFVDLGAGNGNFAKAVQEENIFKTVIASDISDNCVNECKLQGLNSKKCTIEDFNDYDIDCITFNDLIEHVYNPFNFLSSCHDKLRKNGVLMLSTPNGEGFDFKILKEKTGNITPPEHIQYFNPNSIKVLLEKIGFHIINIFTPGILDVDIIKEQIKEKNFNIKENNEFLHFIYSLNNENIEKSFQDFLQKNNLSSHMLIFAKKL